MLKQKQKIAIPWKKILTSIPVWSVISTNFFFFAAQKGTVLNLPLYIKDVLDFTVTEVQLYAKTFIKKSMLKHFYKITRMVSSPRCHLYLHS